MRLTRLPALAILAALAAASEHGVAAAPPSRNAASSGGRAIVVAWDGADWALLDPLVRAGRLPNLAALLAEGRSWTLASYQPLASPLVWTTVATGRNPVDHGVTDFNEIDPRTRKLIPISGRSRKVPAIWNVASSRGVSVGIVGWWATWPAEKVDGFLVSDRAAPVLFDPAGLSASPALTWPEGIADGVRLLARREGTPSYEDVAKALVISRPEFDAAVAAGKDLADPVTGYRKILGSTRVHARIALDLYDRQKPRLLMVYFQGTDEIGHVLGKYHPPKPPSVSDEDFRKYRGGAVAIYVEADRFLGELRERARRDGATLLLLSDHGFKWANDRPAWVSGLKFDTAFLWHRPEGVLVAAGPAVTPSAVRGKASVFDVTPTLCRLLGLPPDPAFEGKVIAGFSGPRVPAPVAAVSWARAATVERLVVRETGAAETKAADEFTKRLVALGYLTGAEAAAVDARPPNRAGTETSGSFQNVGTFLRERGKVRESLEWFRKALEVNPRSPTAWINLSSALHQIGRWEEGDDALVNALRAGYNDPETAVYRRVASYVKLSRERPEARARMIALLRQVVSVLPENRAFRTSLGKALFESKDCAAAETVFKDALVRAPDDVETLNMLALSAWCQGKMGEARTGFTRSLSLNPNQPVVKNALAQLESGGKLPK